MIFSWVQNNIRYIAFEYGLAGWIPDNAQNVLQKKYGDCKGMSNLLKIMLQSAGFDARLVWVGTDGLGKGKEITLPLFDHVICALFRNAKITYLDPTVKYMIPGEYHNGIQNCFTLIENGKDYVIDSVPEAAPSQNTDSLMCIYNMKGNALTGNEVYIDLESSQDYNSGTIDTTKRKIDMAFPYKERTIREKYLIIPAGFEVVSVPAGLNVENDNCKINISYSVKDDKVEYRKEIIIKGVWLKKENFAKWNNDIALLKRKYSEQIILREIKK